jgi:phage FluMu protein Com
MDRVTRCLHCGKRLVPVLANGRTELKCVWCDEVDPMETVTAKWADSPLAEPIASRPSRGPSRSLRRVGQPPHGR